MSANKPLYFQLFWYDSYKGISEDSATYRTDAPREVVESVVNRLRKDEFSTVEDIINALEKAGYYVEEIVIESFDFSSVGDLWNED